MGLPYAERKSPEGAEETCRITEEVLNNDAWRATVTLQDDRGILRPTVADDGVSFEWESATQNGQYGLTRMRERALVCNRKLENADERQTTLGHNGDNCIDPHIPE